jgi:alkyl sulfatase BDS1-like metallo-beta-lactamase superfamily hydrolase
MMDEGLTGPEIANRIALPASLQKDWFDRGYYGAMSFNARAVYQRYMGFYDANPVNLAPLDPADQSARYVAAMGGADRVMALAQTASDKGDYRWAATLLNNVVLGDSKTTVARQALASVYDQLGYQTENAIWRNMYLVAAMELRRGVSLASSAGGVDLIRNLPTSMLLDLVAVRLNPAKVAGAGVRLELVFPERNERFYVSVHNGVLVAEPIAAPGPVDATVTLPRASLIQTLFLGVPAGGAKVDGDATALPRLVSWLDQFKPDFPIVTR